MQKLTNILCSPQGLRFGQNFGTEQFFVIENLFHNFPLAETLYNILLIVFGESADSSRYSIDGWPVAVFIGFSLTELRFVVFDFDLSVSLKILLILQKLL